MKSKTKKYISMGKDGRPGVGVRSLPVLARAALIVLLVSASMVAFWLLDGRGALAGTEAKEQGNIRLTLIRSGGIAGVASKMSMNSGDLSREKAGKLRQLVDKSDFFRLPGTIGSPQPDHYQYRLEVESNGRRHSVTAIGGSSMPEGLKELIQWIIAEGSAKREKSPRP